MVSHNNSAPVVVVVRPVEAPHALAGRFVLSNNVAGLNYNPHYCDVIWLLDLLLFGAACFSRGGSRAYPRPPKIARPTAHWAFANFVQKLMGMYRSFGELRSDFRNVAHTADRRQLTFETKNFVIQGEARGGLRSKNHVG